MPTLHRIHGTSIRVNTPDHQPPHVHVVLADRRDALVYLDSFEVVSATVRVAEIDEALAWIRENHALARKMFEECNP